MKIMLSPQDQKTWARFWINELIVNSSFILPHACVSHSIAYVSAGFPCLTVAASLF